MDCSPPGSSIHGILQTRILEWVAMPFSRGSSQCRDWTQVSHIAGRFFTMWDTREAPTWERWDVYHCCKDSVCGLLVDPGLCLPVHRPWRGHKLDHTATRTPRPALPGLRIVLCLVVQSCLTLCDPLDCSPPGSSVHGILQARILEWVAISFSRESSWPRDRTQVSWTASRFFTNWATRKAHTSSPW